MKLSRQLPVNALRVFEAAARLGSFSKAAEELGMTQTAVSYQIKLLEGHIGKPLFIRQPRQTVLTETGELMLPKIAEGLGCLAEGVGIARKSSAEALEVNAFPTLASRWLARHLGGFQLSHPEFSVRLQRVMKMTDFNASSADVSIEWIESNRPDLVYIELATPTFSPVLTPSLAARIGGVREPADLLKLPRLSAKDRMWQAWFAEAGVENPTIDDSGDNGYESQDLEVYAALEDHGVALAAPFFFRDELASGRLIQPFPITVKAPYPLALVYPRARRNAGKIRSFRDWITATLNADIAAFEGTRQP
jgi:Transcriptional regulator